MARKHTANYVTFEELIAHILCTDLSLVFPVFLPIFISPNFQGC